MTPPAVVTGILAPVGAVWPAAIVVLILMCLVAEARSPVLVKNHFAVLNARCFQTPAYPTKLAPAIAPQPSTHWVLVFHIVRATTVRQWTMPLLSCRAQGFTLKIAWELIHENEILVVLTSQVWISKRSRAKPSNNGIWLDRIIIELYINQVTRGLGPRCIPKTSNISKN